MGKFGGSKFNFEIELVAIAKKGSMTQVYKTYRQSNKIEMG